MYNPSCCKRTVAIFALCAMTAIAASAETFKTIANFNGTNGSFPGRGFLIQGVNGNLYGTTLEGGTKGDGTVFEVTPEGKITVLYSFCSKAKCADGETPEAGLVLAINGIFYGTTYSGGAHGKGTVYEITPAGKLTTLYSFCSKANCADGQNPIASLIQATDGNFYGTTFEGGNANSGGTLFGITPAGKLTTLYEFCSKGGTNCTDGTNPTAAVVQGTNGYLYGTTSGGGGVTSDSDSNLCDGSFYWDGGDYQPLLNKILFAWCLAEAFGAGPVGPLAPGYGLGGLGPSGQGASASSNGNENFYGMTNGGGANLAGAAFEATPEGKVTRLYSFCSEGNCVDGATPNAGLMQGTDGNFYGTTTGGNGNSKCALLNGCGIVFKLTPEGVLTTLHSFEGPDGEYPDAGLVQATSGTFYGTVPNGGADGFGTIFSLSTGLGPFVATVPTSSIEGATINILGQDFTSASKVKFGDLEATDVKLNGATDLIATVPKGALTGALTVTTGSTALTSNRPFGVLPDVSSFSPTSGAVGKSVTITGTGLMQTVAVYFDGVQATEFKVISDTEVTATVPTGAKTGPVSIETQGGTGFSSTDFTVN